MHGDEYRAREGALHGDPTLGDPEKGKGFGITLEQGPAYLTGEVGEVEKGAVVVREEAWDVLWNLLDPRDVDPKDAFERKARRNEGREW